MRICIDFETTGIPRGLNNVGIVQIAAKKFPMDTNIDALEWHYSLLHHDYYEYQSMINPELADSEWEAGAIKTTGIGPAEVENAPTFFEVFHDFAEFCLGCDQWVGYNPEFDVAVLQQSLDKYGFTSHFPWPPSRLDVMKMATDHMAIEGKRGTKWPKLGEIYEHLFDKPLDGAHDAMVDVQGTIEVLLELEKQHG